jgi:ribosome-binding factor A
MGLAQLEATTREVAAKSNKPLFVRDEDVDPTPEQLGEAQRVLRVAQEALSQLSQKDPIFTIRGDPIEILDVEVSRDLRQARVYWTLPFWMMEFPEDVTQRATEKMQGLLDKRGSKLQTLVHARLRHYYPPKLRFVAADGDLLRLTLKGIL